MTNRPEQRSHKVIAAVLFNLTLVAGLWFAVLQPKQAELSARRKLLDEAQEKARAARRGITQAEKLASDLPLAQQRLAAMQAKIPSGDVYRSVTRTFTSLQTNKVEIANLEPPRLGECRILPKIAYKTATFSVSGTAFYHDFGKFLALLENSFPHMRLQRLELEPTQFGDAVAAQQEQLNFKFEILTLVNSSAGEP